MYLHFPFYLVPRPSAPQPGKLITFEMEFVENNENLLVFMLLFEISIPNGNTNLNFWRTVGQSPENLEKKQ